MAKSLKLIVEALLFASDKPLTAKDIHGVLPDVKISELASALRVLKYEYEALGRSFTLREVADAYQFRSHAEYGSHILTLYQSSPGRLSRAALETLAIIAYKQPILRQEVERLRGVDSGGVIRMLMEKGLIRIVGRKNLPGRPLIYGTTKRFLEVFDLKDLESLPKMKEIKALGSDEHDLPTPIQPAAAQGETPVEAGEDSHESEPLPETREESHEGESAPETTENPSEGDAADPPPDAGPVSEPQDQ